MADISMCKDHQCLRKNVCYRYTAFPNPWRQAYFMVSPRTPGTQNCNYYSPDDRNEYQKAREKEFYENSLEDYNKFNNYVDPPATAGISRTEET